MARSRVRLLDALGLLDPDEASQAELEALERTPVPPRNKPKKRRAGKRDKPRDECGRFTKPKSK